MSELQEIHESLVVIFDLEGFSKPNPVQQAKLVHSFVENLDARLNALDDLDPDAYSTGDGAVVSIGRHCKIDRDEVTRFLGFVIDLTSHLLKAGLIVRVAANYSDRDHAVPLDPSGHIKGPCIQIGDTINVAARILTFCDPREIMISRALYELLRKLDLENIHSFHRNDDYVTKHEEVLSTYSYNPPKRLRQLFYCPDSPLHSYKRYWNFPPIKPDTLKYFIDNGLVFELDKVISNAYESMRFMNHTMSFLSWSSVLNVLTSLRYDPEDTVYVLSRNDHAAGFWTQSRRGRYVHYLSSNAEDHEGYINQTRIMVYDDSRAEAELMPDKDIFHDLEKLHNTKTFFRFPAGQLFRFPRVAELRFGFTVSKRHKFAIIPIPSPEEIEAQKLGSEHIGELLKLYVDFDVTDGPMKAVITADDAYVSELISGIEAILSDSQIRKIK